MIFLLKIINILTSQLLNILYLKFIFLFVTIFSSGKHFTGKDWMATWGLADDTTVCVVNLEHAGSPLGP